MKDINIPYLRRGIKHWGKCDNYWISIEAKKKC